MLETSGGKDPLYAQPVHDDLGWGSANRLDHMEAQGEKMEARVLGAISDCPQNPTHRKASSDTPEVADGP